MKTCPHPDCPHEARKRALKAEKRAREAPDSLVALGAVHAGQLCDGDGCGAKVLPGAKVYAHCYMPWVLCPACVERYASRPRSHKVTVEEYREKSGAFRPTCRRKVDMTNYWVESLAA